MELIHIAEESQGLDFLFSDRKGLRHSAYGLRSPVDSSGYYPLLRYLGGETSNRIIPQTIVDWWINVDTFDVAYSVGEFSDETEVPNGKLILDGETDAQRRRRIFGQEFHSEIGSVHHGPVFSKTYHYGLRYGLPASDLLIESGEADRDWFEEPDEDDFLITSALAASFSPFALTWADNAWFIEARLSFSDTEYLAVQIPDDGNPVPQWVRQAARIRRDFSGAIEEIPTGEEFTFMGMPVPMTDWEAVGGDPTSALYGAFYESAFAMSVGSFFASAFEAVP